MSNDYISRADAKEAAALIALTSANREMTCGEVKRIMEGIPPADVRPVVRGEWIETGYFDQDYQPIYECSHCHREVADNFMAKHLFCLHCGADMRPEPPNDPPAPICQTCGNFDPCPWRHEGIFSGPKDKARRVVACSDYKPE